MTSKPIVFLTTNPIIGGAEYLGSFAAEHLASQGHLVETHAPWIDDFPAMAERLRTAGVTPVQFAKQRESLFSKVVTRLLRRQDIAYRKLEKRLATLRPGIVVLTIGVVGDGEPFMNILVRLGIPFVTITHLVSEESWPSDDFLPALREGYRNATRNYFVSKQNRDLAHFFLGPDLPDPHIVQCPFLANYATPVPWPSEDLPLRLALPARILVRHKGHELLLKILMQEKWRQRDVAVGFFGDGPNEKSLQSIAREANLDNVHFFGHVNGLDKIWADHHVLIMPSRREGLPAAIVDAMLSGRPSIVTRVGGNAEILDEGVTGFIAEFPTVEAVDQAMERAWIARADLHPMGEKAAQVARKLYSEDPALDFAGEVLELIPD